MYYKNASKKCNIKFIFVRQHVRLERAHIARRLAELSGEVARLDASRRLTIREMGLPNHLCSRRFSSDELEAMTAVVNNLLAHLGSIAPALPEGPLEPCPAVQVFLEDCADQLPPSCGGSSSPLPWWARLICRGPDAWRGTALKSIDTNDSWMLMYAKGGTYDAWFLQLRPLAVDMSIADAAGEALLPPMHRTEWSWHDPLVFKPAQELGISDDDDVQVLQGLHFEGLVVATNHVAQDFDVWVRDEVLPNMGGMPASEPRAEDSGRCRKVAPSVLLEMMAAHPWLEMADFYQPAASARQHKRQRIGTSDAVARGGDLAADSDEHDAEWMPFDEEPVADDADDAEEEEEAVVAAAEEELRFARAGLGEDTFDYFKVTVLGGEWTRLNLGVAADYVMASNRGGAVSEWCCAVGFPKSRRFSIRLYSLEGAQELAEEFASRGNFFAWQYFEGDAAFVHTAATNRGYVESIGFLDWAIEQDIHSATFDAIMKLRATSPTAV